MNRNMYLEEILFFKRDIWKHVYIITITNFRILNYALFQLRPQGSFRRHCDNYTTKTDLLAWNLKINLKLTTHTENNRCRDDERGVLSWIGWVGRGWQVTSFGLPVLASGERQAAKCSCQHWRFCMMKLQSSAGQKKRHAIKKSGRIPWNMIGVSYCIGDVEWKNLTYIIDKHVKVGASIQSITHPFILSPRRLCCCHK
jgi:hypothetical protein